MRNLGLVGCNVVMATVEDDDEDDVFYLPRVAWDEPDHRHRPRRSFHRTPISLASSLPFANRRRSFCYVRLQQFPLRLTVVKLDGSRFEIEVQRLGRIAELKQAVERAFYHVASKGPDDKISWLHVWGHFCLCYDNKKLVKDEQFIKDYGMRDGDELRFVHLFSAVNSLTKKQTGKRADIQQAPRICDHHEAIVHEAEEAESDRSKNLKCQMCQAEDEIPTTSKESTSMASHSRRKWLLHSIPFTSEKRRFKDEGSSTSKTTTGFMGCFKNIFHLHSSKAPFTPSMLT